MGRESLKQKTRVIEVLLDEIERLKGFEQYKRMYEREVERHEETKEALLKKNTISEL